MPHCQAAPSDVQGANLQGSIERPEKNETSLFPRPPDSLFTSVMARSCDDAGLPLSINRNQQDQIVRENGKTQYLRHFIGTRRNGISMIMPSLAIPDVPLCRSRFCLSLPILELRREQLSSALSLFSGYRLRISSRKAADASTLRRASQAGARRSHGCQHYLSSIFFSDD